MIRAFENATVSICKTGYNITDHSPLTWLCVYSTIVFVTVIGNVLTIVAICSSRRLSSVVSNQFVFSLAVSDLLVGCTIPYHMIYYLTDLENKMTCLARFAFISFACSSSINNVLLIAIDRYMAIVHPFYYYRRMTRELSTGMIILAWSVSMAIGSALFHWNNWQDSNPHCDLSVFPSTYITYCLVPLFVLIWLAIFAFYIQIVREAGGNIRRMKNCITTINGSNGQHKRSILGESKNKSMQMVLMILGCFSFCWLPYMIVVTLKSGGVFCQLFYELSFALAAVNSALNPILYAWKNTSFRQAFQCLLNCKSPNPNNPQFITNYVPSKANSLQNIIEESQDAIENQKIQEKDNEPQNIHINCDNINFIHDWI